MHPRTLSRTAGLSYLIIFFAAIFANFMALEALVQDPVGTVQNTPGMVRWGILAFLVTVVFDVVVAWALQELYKAHPLTGLSTLFRMMHAAIMGVGIFALPAVFGMGSAEAILGQVDTFNTIWLVGLFFFGLHLILLARVLGRPRWITLGLLAAGVMYMVDTAAHFMLPNYESYAEVFLALVSLAGIVGEMSFTVWLLVKGGRT